MKDIFLLKIIFFCLHKNTQKMQGEYIGVAFLEDMPVFVVRHHNKMKVEF